MFQHSDKEHKQIRFFANNYKKKSENILYNRGLLDTAYPKLLLSLNNGILKEPCQKQQAGNG